MLELENYDIVFSVDETQTPPQEVVLLVIEQEDLPKIPFKPSKVHLQRDVLGSLSFQVIFDSQDPAIIVDVDDRKNYDDDITEDVIIECLDFPEDLFEPLSHFKSIWFCTVDQGEVMAEYEIALDVIE